MVFFDCGLQSSFKKIVLEAIKVIIAGQLFYYPHEKRQRRVVIGNNDFPVLLLI